VLIRNLLGFPIYNNAVNGTIGATGIQANGTFTVSNTIFAGVTTNNFYPAVKSALIGAGFYVQQKSPAYDYNGKARSTTKPTVGAYVKFYFHSIYSKKKPFSQRNIQQQLILDVLQSTVLNVAQLLLPFDNIQFKNLFRV